MFPGRKQKQGKACSNSQSSFISVGDRGRYSLSKIFLTEAHISIPLPPAYSHHLHYRQRSQNLLAFAEI